MGRKSIFDRPLTAAERQARTQAKRREAVLKVDMARECLRLRVEYVEQSRGKPFHVLEIARAEAFGALQMARWAGLIDEVEYDELFAQVNQC